MACKDVRVAGHSSCERSSRASDVFVASFGRSIGGKTISDGSESSRVELFGVEVIDLVYDTDPSGVGRGEGGGSFIKNGQIMSSNDQEGFSGSWIIVVSFFISTSSQDIPSRSTSLDVLS